MRRLFTTADAIARGITPDGLRWGERKGAWTRIERGVYGEGPEPPTRLDRQRARVLVSHDAARGALAGVLHDLDSITLDDQPTRRTAVRDDRLVVVAGIQCANVLQTLLDGTFVARLDLSWPPIGLFFELDGQHHAGQPVYDARRETAVVAATGWLPGRFTWHEIVHIPRSTARRFDAIAVQARRRPLAA